MSHPANILIIDDSPNSKQVLSEILEAEGYRVVTATSAEEALPLFKEQRFNFVITELMLPGASGLNVLRNLREIDPEIDIAIISTTANSLNILKALRHGAFDYIIKPIDDVSVLYKMIERSLEKQEAAHQKQLLIGELKDKNLELKNLITIMKDVNRICLELTSVFDVAGVLKKLTELAVECLQAPKGYLVLADKSGKKLHIKVCTGCDPLASAGFNLEKSRGISGLAMNTGKALIVDDITDERYTERLEEEDPTGEMLAGPSILSAPLTVHGKVVGALTISGGCDGKPFKEQHLEFLTMLLNYVSVTIKNAGVLHALKKQS